MSLMTYKDARPWAAAIRESVQSRKMPPWHGDSRFGKFSNDPRLSDSESPRWRSGLLAAAKEGDPAKIPAAPQFAEGWQIWYAGRRGLDSSTRKDAPEGSGPLSQLPGSNGFWRRQVDYGVELRPGNKRMVHHAHVYLFAKRKSNAAEKSASPGITNTIKQGDVLVINPQMPVS